jgi:hypothetical protein
MLQREGGGLLSFRVGNRLDVDGLPVRAERIGDHREAYLTFEGEVSGGRGAVCRVAEGTCEILEETGENVRIRVSLGVVRGVMSGRRIAGDFWEFRGVPGEA